MEIYLFIYLPDPSGTLDALMKISRNEGVRALWSGLPPTLAMAIPSTVLYFTSYDLIKQQLETVKVDLTCQRVISPLMSIMAKSNDFISPLVFSFLSSTF